jgi:hypothetical protein
VAVLRQSALVAPGLKDGRQKTSNANLKDDIQKVCNASFDATNHSFERVTKATQAIVSEITDYSKRSFENGTKTMENLLGVRSLDKAFEVQSEYARTAYEGYVSHASRLGQPYTIWQKKPSSHTKAYCNNPSQEIAGAAAALPLT